MTQLSGVPVERGAKDVGKAASLHGAILKAIASGDEVAAATAANAMVDYAEFYTRGHRRAQRNFLGETAKAGASIVC